MFFSDKRTAIFFTISVCNKKLEYRVESCIHGIYLIHVFMQYFVYSNEITPPVYKTKYSPDAMFLSLVVQCITIFFTFIIEVS